MDAQTRHEIMRSVFALFGEPYPVTDVALTWRTATGQTVRYVLTSDTADLNIVSQCEELEPSPNGARCYKQTGYTWFLAASGRVTNDGRYNGKIVREVL